MNKLYLKSINPNPTTFDEDSLIQCEECLAIFKYSQLQNNDDCIFGNDYDPAYNDRICPKCGEYDCARIVKETKEEFLDRTRSDESPI